jgi:hypothetical protein
MWFTQNNYIVGDLACRTTTHLSWRWDRFFFINIWIFQDICWLRECSLTYYVFLNSFFINDFTLWHIPQRNLKLCIHPTDLGSRSFGPLLNTFRRDVFLIKLRSPLMTWPAGIYMNGKLGQVQSGGVDFQSSMLRFCRKFLSS